LPYRILHVADVHLDMAFAGSDAGAGEARRAHLEGAFERVLELAAQRKADALCIAGDLYENRRSTPDRAAYLARVLGALAPMRVFISPGNHDPIDSASLYRLMAVPGNVTIFDTRRFAAVALADGLTLWGCGHEFELDREPLLGGFKAQGKGTHLLLGHGSDREHMPPGKEAIAPFSGAEIAASRVAHAMLGHFHGMLQGKHYAYPGSPEPHHPGQSGRHTASLVTVEDGRVGLEFIDVNHTRFADADLDLSEFGDRAALADGVAARLRALAGRNGETVFCRVRLVGNALPTLDVDLAALARELAGDFPGASIEEAFTAIDPDAVAHEGYTVRAEFVRELQRRMEAAPEPERAELELALRYGLQAFAGKRLAP
jgi:DNA repair protein SbcD/Mre11